MKNKWFWGVIIVILVSWIGNIIYFQTKQLSEPIILNAYIDRPSYERTSFSLPYLTNKNEVVELDHLLVDGYTYSNEQSFTPWFNEPSTQSYTQEFTHHFLKEATFTLDEQDLKRLQESIQTNKVFARFTNGQVVPVQVDKLSFTPFIMDETIFTNTRYFTSNQGIQGHFLEVVESVTMNSIELPEVIQTQFDLKIMVLKNTSTNSTKVNDIVHTDWLEMNAPLYTDIEWPLLIEAGDTVALIFHTKDEIEDVEYISALQEWTGETLNGGAVRYSFLFQNDLYLSQKQLNAFLRKARGEAK
ncbi:hypothetical protein ACFVR1_09070 [Psychrobacillus sp. NPDC058041]|uniref:hypothetical protein n=1 Tax=Psychrobacillus sp. NPDC058041 TaxID=3346310 RepID=UPI0036D87D72